MTPLELKFKLDEAKKGYYQGIVTLNELDDIVNRYIASVQKWAKDNKKKPPLLSRAKLLR